MTRSALVTGASRGIGLATARALAEAGVRVFATSRAPDRSPELQDAARAGAVEALTLDVDDERSVREALTTLVGRIGDVPDIVVSNAGTGVVGALEEVSAAELHGVLQTNLLGPARVARAVVGRMRERRRGRIVHVGSIGGRVAVAGLGAYSASKAALAAFNDTLRRELRPFGVEVVLVEPGAVKTELIGPARPVATAAREAGSPYRAVTELITRSMQRSFDVAAMPVDKAGRAVARAALTPAPAPRYLLGLDARLLAALAWIPSARVEDALIRVLFERVMSLGTLRGDRSAPASPPSPPATAHRASRMHVQASS